MVECFYCKFIYGDCRVYGQNFGTRSETSVYYSGLLFKKISSKVFYYEANSFNWFLPESSYIVLFTILLCMILTWYWYLFVLTRFIHNNLINNLGLKIVNSINWGLNFPTISSNHAWTCSNWLGCLYASLSQTLKFFWLKDKIAVWTGGQW